MKAFVSKVMQSPLLTIAGLKLLQNTDLKKLVEPLMKADTVSALPSVTWNHGKVLAVNGQTLMTGGINYYTEYTMKSKHDISDTAVRIHGDAAVSGHRWADYFWRYGFFSHHPTKSLTGYQILNQTFYHGQAFSVSRPQGERR